jgi:hypothetical protein
VTSLAVEVDGASGGDGTGAGQVCGVEHVGDRERVGEPGG